MKEITNTSSPITNTLAHALLLLSILLSPLLVIPFFANFMVTTKILLVLVIALLLVGLFIWHTFHGKALQLPRSPLVGALFLVGLSAFLSSVLANQYPVENLLGLGGVYLSAAVIAIIGGLLIRGKSNQDFQVTLNASVIILGVLTLAQVLGFGPSRFINALAPYLSIPNTGIFNLAGSPFLAAQLFGLVLVANAFTWLKTRKNDVVGLAAIVVSVIGLLVTIPVILPGKEATPLLLPPGASWTVAVDVLKEPRSALIGVGPESYSNAYSIFKPAWVNGQVWWNSLFGQGFDVPLTLLATGGLIGLATWLLLAAKTVSQAREHNKQLPFLTGVLVGSFVLELLFPANVVLIMIQAAAFAFFIANIEPRKNTTIHLFKVDREFLPLNILETKQKRSLVMSVLPLLIAIVISGIGLYGVGRAYAASYVFFQSNVAIQNNDAVKVYELQQQATSLNPFVASYRSNYALTNLAIASALANKADVTPQEQEQIGALIQQSIREARAATLLRPDDYQTWTVLAQIYRNLIGSVEGADQWTISSYVEAINANPTDPLLRIDLGGVFFAQQQYAQAAALFQQAAELKPDLPNAYYNLANALKSAGNLEQARLAYQQTLVLLPADSEEYILANQELEALEAQIVEQGSGEEAELVPTETSNVPSITDQNVTETNNSVITQPSDEDLNITETPGESPAAASPVVSPTP